MCRDNMIQHLHGELNAHHSLIIQLKQQVSALEMDLAKKVCKLLILIYYEAYIYYLPNKANFYLHIMIFLGQ